MQSIPIYAPIIHLKTVLLNPTSTLLVCLKMTNSWLVIRTSNSPRLWKRPGFFLFDVAEYHCWEKQLFQCTVFIVVFWYLCDGLTQSCSCLTSLRFLYKQYKPNTNCCVIFSFPLFISPLFNYCFTPLLLKITLFLKAKCTFQILLYPQTS